MKLKVVVLCTVVTVMTALAVRFLQPAKLAFSQTKAFDPPVDERDPARKVRFVDQAHFRAATAPCSQAEIVTLLEVSRPGEQKQSAVATCTDTPEGTRVRVDCGGRRYDVLLPRGNCHLTFVTTYGLRKNGQSGMVQSEVTLDDLFKY